MVSITFVSSDWNFETGTNAILRQATKKPFGLPLSSARPLTRLSLPMPASSVIIPMMANSRPATRRRCAALSPFTWTTMVAHSGSTLACAWRRLSTAASMSTLFITCRVVARRWTRIFRGSSEVTTLSVLRRKTGYGAPWTGIKRRWRMQR